MTNGVSIQQRVRHDTHGEALQARTEARARSERHVRLEISDLWILYNLTMSPDVQPDSVRIQLQRLVSSKAFASSARSGKLLTFLVEGTLNGNPGGLKEYTIGAQALERGDSFDPRTDPIVRAEASRLRTRLALYYSTEGLADQVAISLPKGSYVPVFETRTHDRAVLPASDRRWKMTALAFAALALIALGWSWRAGDSRPAPFRRFEVELRSGGSLGGTVSPDVAISPDGSLLIFIAQDANAVARIYRLPLDEQTHRRLKGRKELAIRFSPRTGSGSLFKPTASSGRFRQRAGPASCCAPPAIPTAELGV
jgi:hypothetical protein